MLQCQWGKETPSKDQLLHPNITLCGGFLSSQPRGRGSGVHSQLHHPASPISSLWGHRTPWEEQGGCMASTMHHVHVSWLNCLPPFVSRYNILILLQMFMSPLSEICNKLGSFSIAIPRLLMLSVTFNKPTAFSLHSDHKQVR